MLLLLALLGAASAPQDAPRLSVHVVDRDGNLLVDGWRVEREVARGGRWQGRRVDPRSGVAELAAFPDGRERVRAVGPFGLAARTVVARRDGPGGVDVRLRYDGPVPERSVFLDVAVEGGPVDLALGALVAVGGGVERPLVPFDDFVPGWRGSRRVRLFAHPLPPGAYAVEVRDPRLRATEALRVHTGDSAPLVLTGSAGVVLALDDRAPDEAIVELLRGSDRRFAERRVVRGRDWPVVYEGLVPDDYTVLVTCPDRPSAMLDVAALAPGERRRRAFTLPPGVGRDVRVVTAEGAPAAGLAVAVQLEPPEARHDERLRRFLQEQRRRGRAAASRSTRAAVTDADGAFRIDGLPTGRHDVVLDLAPWSRVVLPLDVDGAPDGTLELALPPLAEVEVALDLEQSDDPARYRLVPLAEAQRADRADAHAFRPFDAAGRCALEHVPAGELRLLLFRVEGRGDRERFEPLGHERVAVEPGVDRSVALRVP